jgi:hypothetical protein
MFKLIQRDAAPPYRFKVTPFESLDEAAWKARESNEDYLIEEAASGVAPAGVVKYRVGEFEMG